MQRIIMRITLLIGIFVIVDGYAGNPNQRYSGDHLTESTRATIKPWKKEIPRGSKESRIVLLLSIDGKETELPSRNQVSKYSYFISPGEHTIKTALFAVVIGRKKQIINPKPMVFKAKTGHTYITKAYLPDLKQSDLGKKIKLSFWIEDENTGEVVSGTKLTNLPRVVPGTATDSELQSDITQRLFVEASKYYHDCEHNVLKAEVYRSSQRSVIASEMGGKVPELEQRLRDKNQMLVEKWFVKSCDTVGKYEVLLLKAKTGTDIMVKKLEPLQ